MKFASLLSLVVLQLAFPGADAILLEKRDVPAVVGLDIQRKRASDPVRQDQLRKRGKTVSAVLDNTETQYICNITLGTPGQHFRLAIDTGSSDLWCNAANSTLCSSQGAPCMTSGTYDFASSSTSKIVSSDFNISYADGSGASGDYVTDTLSIGGVSLNNFQFGVGYTSSSSVGIAGIGYTTNEAQVGVNGQAPYANLPQAMVNSGLITSNAYSLWLDDLASTTGSILFGGVNTAKYHGQLETLPILSVDGQFSEFLVALTGIALNTQSSTHNYTSAALPTAALLDSGTSLIYLPDSLVASIYSDLNVTYDSSNQIGSVPCSLGKEDLNITFTFSGASITVGILELVLGAGTGSGGTAQCVFGILPSGGSTTVLGDTFLRSAYVVYDLANNEISLANTNFSPSNDNILEITTGTNAVPSATVVPNPVTAVAAGTAGSHLGAATSTPTIIASSGGSPITKTVTLGHLVAGIAGAGLFLVI